MGNGILMYMTQCIRSVFICKFNTKYSSTHGDVGILTCPMTDLSKNCRYDMNYKLIFIIYSLSYYMIFYVIFSLVKILSKILVIK
jgi:hypothetical protein